MICGIAGVTEALANFSNPKKSTRIFYLTDAIPNDNKDKPEMLNASTKNVEKNIFTTFIGLGIDFNVGFINDIASIKGSNYYSIKSASDFKKNYGY